MPSCKSVARDGEVAIHKEDCKKKTYCLPLQIFASEVSVLSPFLSWDVVSAEIDKWQMAVRPFPTKAWESKTKSGEAVNA